MTLSISRIVLLPVALTAVFASGCTKPCEVLDERICKDLGAEDCKIWKEELNREGSPSVMGLNKGPKRARAALGDLLMGENAQTCKVFIDKEDGHAEAVPLARHYLELHKKAKNKNTDEAAKPAG